MFGPELRWFHTIRTRRGVFDGCQNKMLCSFVWCLQEWVLCGIESIIIGDSDSQRPADGGVSKGGRLDSSVPICPFWDLPVFLGGRFSRFWGGFVWFVLFLFLGLSKHVHGAFPKGSPGLPSLESHYDNVDSQRQESRGTLVVWPKCACFRHCQLAPLCSNTQNCDSWRGFTPLIRRSLKTTFNMTLIFSTEGCSVYPFDSFKRVPWCPFLLLVTENPLPGKSPLETTRVRTPEAGTPQT